MQRKPFTKFSTLLWLQLFKKWAQKKTYLNRVKVIYNKPTVNIFVNGEKPKEFPLISGARQGFSLTPLLFNIVLEVLATAVREEKEIKGIQNSKEVKLSLFADDMIIYKWSEVKSFSRVWLFATPWTVAYQAPPSMGCSRQECWRGLPFPSPWITYKENPKYQETAIAHQWI